MKSVIANDKITAKQVLLIDGELKSTLAVSVALDKAYSRGLDLVQVSEGDVPVVKITDLNKFEYEKKQAEKEAKKKQRANAVSSKEIQFTFGTQEHDLAVKAKSALKFLTDGKSVRVVMKIQGHVQSNPAILEKNKDNLSSFIERLGDVEVTQDIQVQGKFCTCVVKPK